jgi:F-type H+-transporting ATPase subunit delta
LVDQALYGDKGLGARYAAALYALAEEGNVLDAVVEQMAALGRLLAADNGIATLLANPLVRAEAETPRINEALAAQGVGPLVQNYLRVAIANRRGRDLARLIEGFAAYVAARRGEIVAEVTTAHPLADLQRTQLLARLTEAGYGKVKLAEKVDATLLGGLVLKIGARLFDSSLKSRLIRLTYSLKGAA